jgi:tRNA/rRNA methyltransferase
MENRTPPAAEADDGHRQAPVSPPVVILVEPQLGENIGQAARAMANFGLKEMRLVAPRDGWPNEKARANAAGASLIVENAQIFSTVEDATADLHFLVATTARIREMLKPVATPETAAREFAARTARGERCGILFGRERWGLENDEVSLADTIVIAPVDPAFASLNLAQAVLLLGYEWRKATGGASLGRATPCDGPAREGLALNRCSPATRDELLHFFAHLETELTEGSFFKTDAKRSTMLRNIRNIFLRASLTSQEVGTLRGIIRALTRLRRLRNRVE